LVDIVQGPIPQDAPGVFKEPEGFQIRQSLSHSDWHVLEKWQDSYDTAGGLVMAL
jgi:hypothetical protein